MILLLLDLTIFSFETFNCSLKRLRSILLRGKFSCHFIAKVFPLSINFLKLVHLLCQETNKLICFLGLSLRGFNGADVLFEFSCNFVEAKFYLLNRIKMAYLF